MSWHKKAFLEAWDLADSEFYAREPEQLFTDGAQWQRDQLRTDEAIERVARAVWAESYTREKDHFEDEWRSARNYYKVRAERLITALLGDN